MGMKLGLNVELHTDATDLENSFYHEHSKKFPFVSSRPFYSKIRFFSTQ